MLFGPACINSGRRDVAPGGLPTPGFSLEVPVRKVLVGVPFVGHWVTFGIARFAMACGFENGRLGRIAFDVRFLTGSSVISHNVEFMRNCLVGAVLNDPTITDLWFIDSDTLPSDNAFSLLHHDADIVAGIYRIPSGEDGKLWSAYTPVEGNMDKFMTMPDRLLPEGPFEAAGAGTGAMIIKRHVLASAKMRLAVTKEGDPPAVFRTVRGPHGSCEMTDDLDFCRRARRAGFKILVDPRVRFGHIKERLYLV